MSVSELATALEDIAQDNSDSQSSYDRDLGLLAEAASRLLRGIKEAKNEVGPPPLTVDDFEDHDGVEVGTGSIQVLIGEVGGSLDDPVKVSWTGDTIVTRIRGDNEEIYFICKILKTYEKKL